MVNNFDLVKDETPKEFEFYCYKNCLRLLYKYYGEKFPMNKIFCGKAFSIEKGELICDKNDNGIFCQNNEEVIEYSLKDYSMKEIYIKDKEFLDRGKPIIIAVDPYFLPYSKYYMEKHAYHTVILINLFEERNSTHILDWYVDEKYDGEVSIDDLDLARTSKNEGGGIMNFTPINARSFVLINSSNSITAEESLYYFSKRVFLNFYLEGWSSLVSIENTYEEILQKGKRDWDDRFHITFKELMFLYTRTELETYYFKSIINLLQVGDIDQIMLENNEIIKKLKLVRAVGTKLTFSYNDSNINDFLKYFRDYLSLERKKYSRLAELMFNLERIVEV